MPELKAKKPLWAVVATWTLCLLPVLYVFSSGPVRGQREGIGMSRDSFRTIYRPLVWLKNNTIAEGPIGWYWGLFESPDKDEWHAVGRESEWDSLMKHTMSPRAQAIERSLGYGN